MKKTINVLAILIVLAGFLGFFLKLEIAKYKQGLPGLNGCTMEAKVCSDGSSVGRTGPNCEFVACPMEDVIKVETPRANETVLAPIIIKGLARGNWFFEATFPIEILDDSGNIIAQAVANAKSDWMTTDFVEFESSLDFKLPKSKTGVIVLKKSNPSGMQENDAELRIPIIFEKESQNVKLYFYNSNLDKDELGNTKCSRDGLVAVERQIPKTQTPIQDAIKLLIKGEITEKEKASGISTEYPLAGFSLKGASLKNGILTVEFNDPNNKASGGSCRVGILWFQIEKTAKQFSGVTQVKFLPEDIFQP